MLVFDMLRLLAPELRPEKTKIHLAGWNGYDDPLDVFLAGRFPEWQSFQSQRNFERPFVLSLIRTVERDRWLFGGVHKIEGPAVRVQDPTLPDQECWRYPISETPGTSALTGRLVANFARPGRQSYLVAENWIERITLAEVYPRRLSIGDFPGYRAVALTFDELRLVTEQGLPSWRAALSNVGGVYLISDTETGKLYVGSAAGARGHLASLD